MIQESMYEKLDFKERVNIIARQNFPSSYPIHWHTQIELLFLSPEASNDETLSVLLNQTSFTLHKGDILIIWPGELHEILSTKSENIFAFQFSPDLLTALPEFAGKYSLLCHEHYISAGKASQISSEMIEQLLQLAFHHTTNDAYRGIHMLIHIYECFLIYAQYVDTLFSRLGTSIPTYNKETMQKINAACTYIRKYCTKTITLDEVANYTGFSRYYFSRIFKQVTEYAFIEYLAKQRIGYAQKLLSDSKLSITEVAFQSGFKSIPTFNRVFKKWEGYSPSEFRQLYAK